MAGTSCRHSGECVAMLSLSGFFSNPFSDDWAVQNASCKIKSNSDFFASDRMERIVFQQDVPTICSASWGSPDYDGLLKDALESIAHRLERDLERNEPENNCITYGTAKNLKSAVGELEYCGISTEDGGYGKKSKEAFAGVINNMPIYIVSFLNDPVKMRILDQLLE